MNKRVLSLCKPQESRVLLLVILAAVLACCCFAAPPRAEAKSNVKVVYIDNQGRNTGQMVYSYSANTTVTLPTPQSVSSDGSFF